MHETISNMRAWREQIRGRSNSKPLVSYLVVHSKYSETVSNGDSRPNKNVLNGRANSRAVTGQKPLNVLERATEPDAPTLHLDHLAVVVVVVDGRRTRDVQVTHTHTHTYTRTRTRTRYSHVQNAKL